MKSNSINRSALSFLLAVGIGLSAGCASAHDDIQFCKGQSACHGKNPRVKNVQMIQQNGARPRWSPDGASIVFDRPNSKTSFQVYVMDSDGKNVRAVTEGKKGIPQASNGNAIFDPSGKWILFISEDPDHFMPHAGWAGNPGVGLYSNFWAVDLEGKSFFQLTHIPMKKRLFDRIPVFASVNPLFSPDGHQFVWTERYADGPKKGWGLWRIKTADFAVEDGHPVLKNEKVLFTPKTGNYVTAMGFLSPTEIVFAGNLDGQHEYGMDQYVYDTATGQLRNLTHSPDYWEEDSSVTPDHKIIYMSNVDSKFKFDMSNPHWEQQAITREYYVMDADGSHVERLTYFNEPSAPENAGKRIMAVASDVSPDGRFLAATLAVDNGTGAKRKNSHLEIARIEFDPPFR